MFTFDTDVITTGSNVSLFVLGTLMGASLWIKSWWKTRNKHKKEGTDLDQVEMLDNRIHDLLGALRENLMADRATVVKFHNGGDFFDGTSRQKVTCTHESVSAGFLALRSIHIEIPISQLSPIIRKMLKSPGERYTVADLPDGYAKSDMTALGISDAVIYPITFTGMGGSEKIIGYVGVHWVKSFPENIPDDKWDRANQIVGSITSVIQNRTFIEEGNEDDKE